MKIDWNTALADYRGVLGWVAFVDGLGVVHPAVEIPLYIKELGLPLRKPKINEISTIPQVVGNQIIRTNLLFWNSPDVLQMQLSGWLITPVTNNQWDPKQINGLSLNIGNLSYADVISSYLDGRMNPNLGGYLQRRDPDYFITPQGKKYLSPVIATWEPTYTTVQKKTPFNMTLYLEK